MPIAEFAALGVAFCLVVVVPLVAILTEHQRKMAKLLNNRHGDDDALLAELRALRMAVEDLRSRSGSQQLPPPPGYPLPPVAETSITAPGPAEMNL